MSKEVRNIFLTLVGTVVFIVLSSIMIEIGNISLSSIQLKQNIRLSCDKALDLFAQESYKVRNEYSGANSGTIGTDNIIADDGSIALTGNFYVGTTQDDIYLNLYDTSRSSAIGFESFCSNFAHNWQSINLLNKYLNDPTYFTITTMPQFSTYYAANPTNVELAFQQYEAAMETYTEYAIAKSYYDTRMTPMNFGVPYFDKETVERMFRWNLASILSNCGTPNAAGDTLVKHDPTTGEYYVLVDGFKVYFTQAYIKSINHEIFDLSDTTQAQEFKALTNIDPDNLGFLYESEYLGTADDERQRICVAYVEYSVPIEYEGITPIKQIFNWVWDNEVEGFTGTGHQGSFQPWTDSREELVGGGEGDTLGVLPVPGKLIFYLVR